MRPERIDIVEDGAALTLAGALGELRLSAEALRRAARDSASEAARRRGAPPQAQPGLAILGVEQVGAYGVNIIFSDGCGRAIYPWSYLTEIARGEHQSKEEIGHG